MTWTLPPHFGASGGISGKASMHGPLAGILAAISRSVVFTLLRIGAGSGRSSGDGVCHAPPSLLRSWLSLGALYSLSAEFWTIMFSYRSMGRMFKSWCKGSRGVVRNVPDISLTASFWTVCSFLTSITCFPLYHSWHPYVRTGRQMALYARRHRAWSSPRTELPSSCRDLRVARARLHIMSTWCVHDSRVSKKKPRYLMVFTAATL
jgi:hypothetical protein